jgi:NADH-quinone oxidoreductase subunit F
MVKASGLRGRGGAGFPTGLKWSFMPRTAPGRSTSCAIRTSPSRAPARTATSCATTRTRCSKAWPSPATRPDRRGLQLPARRVPPRAVRTHFEQALKDAYAHGWLGKNILGSGIDIDIHNALGAGAYICGEETALMESLEGKKGQPRFKPPFPANFGLYGKPTTINNTETYASVPAILRNGGEWFLNLGKPNNGGPKIFSVSGHVNNPGNFEIRLGTPFKDLLAMAGGVRGGRKLKAVIPGGSSMPVLPGDTMMGLHHGLRRHAEGGLRPGLGRGDRDGRDHLHGAGLPAHLALLLTPNPAASARRAAKAPAGCIAC